MQFAHLFYPLALGVCSLALVVPARSAEPSRAAATRSILVLGDSLASGYGVGPDLSYPALIQRKIIDSGLPYDVINAGISGSTSADGRSRIAFLLKQKIDVLVIELGGNDFLRGLSPAATKANLEAIITQARAKFPTIKVLLAGMELPPQLAGDYIRGFNEIYAEVAAQSGAAHVPSFYTA